METPLNNMDAVTKNYMDDKECKFKDGTTTTSDVDLRTTASGSKFYDDVTFKANAKCKNLNVLSSSDAIVNKNLLETGRLVGIQRLSSTVMSLITSSLKHELLVMKGRPTNSTIITEHHSFNGNPMLTADTQSASYTLNSEGVYNRFLKQELEKISSEPKLLGLHMTWVFETDDLYFYIERLKSI